MYDQYDYFVWSKMAATTKHIQSLRQKCESSRTCANKFLSDLQNNENPSIEPLLKGVDDIKNDIKKAIDMVMDHLNEWKRSNVKAVKEQFIGSYDEVGKIIWNHTDFWQCDPILLQHGGRIRLDTVDHIQVKKKTTFLKLCSKNVHFSNYIQY